MATGAGLTAAPQPARGSRARERAAAAARARLAVAQGAGRAGACKLSMVYGKIGEKAITFIDLEPESCMVSLDECKYPG